MKSPEDKLIIGENQDLLAIHKRGTEIKTINNLVALYNKRGLTKEMAYEWLNSLPEDQRDKERFDLESGICEDIDNLPERIAEKK
ncbi:MAG: hypothetical protein UT48_C0001G0088 [Parcubacteria group bacterium GW2011_GWE2_39_37]|uniref:Uncharacterized protein n=1 Tax=Candidatus Falkowbacteria bacterium GW2011_GWF2_39_8 TaxID=1618642 RepID=A0A0G0Q0L9_9BACT|nr:MAG: hypothetical protein UT48_C0001G0088 [Parcubacteria group bacterium GW2011_GWE2_39_37]KKR33703.1 MAG: hypothetical protein UT64_C0004G0010 [Candidatus Falkowbacteria bacterium GW2011_GWF2_39_8]